MSPEEHVTTPQTTLVILLGASKWPYSPEFQGSKAFANVANDFRKYLFEQFGLPTENFLLLFDKSKDFGPDKIDREIRQWLDKRTTEMKDIGNPARDLLFYFVGHGGFAGRNSEYYLALQCTSTDNPQSSGIQIEALAKTLTEKARHLRRFIILDCCYAAAAFTAFQAEGPAREAFRQTVDAFEESTKSVEKGTSLLCSSGKKVASLLTQNGNYTMFSMALLHVLHTGDPLQQDRHLLSLREVADLTARVLHKSKAPRPELHSPDQVDGIVADIPLFPNPASKVTEAIQRRKVLSVQEVFGTRDEKRYEESTHPPDQHYGNNASERSQNTSILERIAPFSLTFLSKANRVWRKPRIAAILLLVLGTLSPYLFIYYRQYAPVACNVYDIFSPVNVMHSLYFSHNIRVTHAADGECIGLSDGDFAFDVQTNPANGRYKQQAANALMSGDRASAETYWNEAIQKDSSDAEALIYKENENVQNLAASQKLPYVTVVLMAELTGRMNDHSSVANGRRSLQGAYIAQIQRNRNFGTPLLRILIANCGGTYTYAEQIADQIIQAKQADPTIVGVMGPSQTWDTTISAIKKLGQAHIPMISETASSDALTNISPYFFRVSPTNKLQADFAAIYAEKHFHAKTAVVFQALNDNYSTSLTRDFMDKFVKEDKHAIVKLATYDATKVNTSNTISYEASNACGYNPDFIYFTGRSDAMWILLNSLSNIPCGKSGVKIIGGDSLDQLTSSPGVGYPSYAYNRLYYTSSSFPQEWHIRGLEQHQPSFFNDYAKIFDPSNLHPGLYGSSLPDAQTTLAYDAMATMLSGIVQTMKRIAKSSFRLEDLQYTLSHIHGVNAVQGASGIIDFGLVPNGDPENKVVVMIQITEHGNTKFVDLQGQLFRPGL